MTRAGPAPEPASVAAVIVTFHPGPGLADTVASLLTQVGAVVIVDNGSCPADLPTGDDPAFHGRVEMIANGENRGVGAALNQGLGRAKERGFGWALTLDQDSVPLPNLVAAGGRAFQAYPEPDRLAAIGDAGSSRRLLADSCGNHLWDTAIRLGLGAAGRVSRGLLHRLHRHRILPPRPRPRARRGPGDGAGAWPQHRRPKPEMGSRAMDDADQSQPSQALLRDAKPPLTLARVHAKRPALRHA